MRKFFQSLLLVSLLVCGAREASAQTESQIADLNSQALDAYQALDIETARAKLETAIGLAQQSGLVSPVVAQTYMNLGVLYVAAHNDRDQGLTAFVSAICMQPEVQLDPLLSTPEVEQVFAQGQQDAQGGACGPGTAPPQTAPPQLLPTEVPGGPQNADVECPPGVVCNNDGEPRDAGRKDFARFFINLQLTVGMALVMPGMVTDGAPPRNSVTGLPDVFSVVEDHNNDGVVNEMDDLDQDGLFGNDQNGDGVPDDMNMDGYADPSDDARFYFDDRSPWIPDADSFDDFENEMAGVPRGRTPVSAQCPADGTETGPTAATLPNSNFNTLEPSSYCARVVASGMVPSIALRLNPGYFITESFALSLPFRLQFSAGEGSFSSMLIGVRGELLFSEMDSATGFPISWFFGATYGQIQAKPPAESGSSKSPFVISGPIGVHTGLNVRWRLHRNFGLIAAPEFDLQFPDLLFNIDMSIGAEAAF